MPIEGGSPNESIGVKDLFQDFKKRTADLLAKRGTYLLALSGGMDSICLAHLLLRSGVAFEAAHCNYGLRGAESEGDETFVREFCEVHNVFLHVKATPLEGQSNIQARARDLRYSWFRELLKERNLNGICTAHHADDNIENLFIALVRGTGLKGLAGMWPAKGDVFRPLLFARRADIEGYIIGNGLKHREDSSNASNKYLRNRVRHEVLPLLEEMRAGSAEKLIHDQVVLRQQLLDLENYYATLEAQCVQKDDDHFRIDLEALKTMSEPSGFMHHLLQPLGFSTDNIQKVLTASVGSVFNGTQHQLNVDRNVLLVGPVSPTDQSPVYIDSGQQQVEAPVRLAIQELDTPEPFSNDPRTAQFDLSKLTFPLELRTWQAGDKIQPLGMSGHKLVSDLLIDEKVPLTEKGEIKVLCSANEVVWVLGLRISERFKVEASTKKVLLIGMR